MVVAVDDGQAVEIVLLNLRAEHRTTTLPPGTLSRKHVTICCLLGWFYVLGLCIIWR